MKRSYSPILWLLFGAGGMLAALTAPVLIFIVGLAVPSDFILSHDTMSYAHMQTLLHSVVGKLAVLALIVLYLWHAAHRIFKSLHDIGIHPSAQSRLACYGTAMFGTVVALVCVVAIGF